MPPKAAPPPSAASKGKGKEEASTATDTSSNTNTTSSTSTATNATSSASANAGAAAQRRQPIGKVIHYFADNQSQGYDGNAFQEAYKTQILAKVQEIQDAKQGEKTESDELDVSDDDLQALMSLTGLKKESAREYFTKAKSTKVEDACRAYLHPENYTTTKTNAVTDEKVNGSGTVVPAAA